MPMGLGIGLGLSQPLVTAAATGIDTGWVSPSAQSSVAISGDTGTLAWGSPGNLSAADSTYCAIATKGTGNTATLRVLFDLSSLPSSGSITKISLRQLKYAVSPVPVDLLLSLINADAQAQADRVGPNKATTDDWPGSDGPGVAGAAWVTYEWTGADLSGITLSALKSVAGIHFRANRTSAVGGGFDTMQIRVEGTA